MFMTDNKISTGLNITFTEKGPFDVLNYSLQNIKFSFVFLLEAFESYVLMRTEGMHH
jgi:hypothetical protein